MRHLDPGTVLLSRWRNRGLRSVSRVRFGELLFQSNGLLAAVAQLLFESPDFSAEALDF